MARQRKVIDRALVVRLAARGYGQKEIGLFCGVSDDTLRRRCANELERGCLLRDSSLRKKQFDLAMAGNATMLIWLGKNLLGQTDRQEITGPAGGPVQVETMDLTKLSDEELKSLERLIEKAHEKPPEKPDAKPKPSEPRRTED